MRQAVSFFYNLVLNDGENLREVNDIKILAAGCGENARDFFELKAFFPKVIGVDINLKVKGNGLFQTSVEEFACNNKGKFDYIFSCHVLEHCSDPDRHLYSLASLITETGKICLGTPNRARIVGYIGSDVSLREKIVWNLEDWQAKLTGRFENRLGAHAGFTEKELEKMMCRYFKFQNISLEYYKGKYGKGILGVLIKVPVLRPAIYYCCRLK